MLAFPEAVMTTATPADPPGRYRRARSLRGYLAILALGLALPAALFVGVLLWQFAAAERARLEERVPGTARAIARAVDRELTGLIAALEVLSLSPALQTGDLASFHSRAEGVQERTGIAVVLRDLEGRQLVHSGRAWGEPLPGLPLPKLDAEVLRTRRPAVSDLFLSAGTEGEPLFAVEGPILVGAAREVRYLLGLSLPARRVLGVIEGQRPPHDWTVGVIDGAGVVMARTPRNADFAGRHANPDFVARAAGPEGWWRGTTLDGLPVLSGYARTELAGWVVAAGVPERTLSAPLRRSMWTLAGCGLVLAAFSGALALALGRRIAAPIGAPARAAEALGRGEPVTALGGGISANGVPLGARLREAATVGEALTDASARLREREGRLRLQADLLDQAGEAAIVWSFPSGPVQFWNRGAEALYGFSRAEAIGRVTHELLCTDHADLAAFERELWLQGVWTGELLHRTRAGREITVESRHALFHGPDGAVLVMETNRDVTERRQAERRQAFLLSFNDEVWGLGRADEILAAAARTLGGHLAVSRVGYGEVDPPGLHLTVERIWTDGTVGDAPGRYRMADFGPEIAVGLRHGQTVRVEDVASDDRTSGEGPAAAFAAISVRAVLAVPLVKEGRLTAVVYLHDREPRPWSDADAELVREVAERTWSALARARAEAALRRANEGLEGQVALRTRELVAEMTRREEAEAQLRQAQKIEALGQLTGGVAHDFNNLLQAIVGSLDLLGRSLAGAADGDEAARERASTRARRHLDNAKEAALRAAALTRRLLAFARRQTLAPEPLDVNRLVAGMSDLLGRTVAVEGVRIETALPDDLWWVHADPNQLENAILNLAVNARDAMPGGGVIRVEAANADLDETYARYRPEVVPGRYVVVSVSDTGSGMAPEIAARAFDPFFTTKPLGQGTGLGLSQVHGFARQSGGHAELESAPGRGTTVRLYLPRHAAESAGASPSPDAASAARPVVPAVGRGETVLVAEDEAAVRRFSVEALRELGYRTLEADGAAGALRLIDGHPEVSLLLADVVMPGVNGRRLADEAVRRRPGLKILFMTGHAPGAAALDGVLDADAELLGKPFTLERLAGKLRTVLSGEGAGPGIGPAA